MPMEVSASEWAAFTAAHKCYAREPKSDVMEHVLTDTKEIVARIEYGPPKKYFIFPEIHGTKNGYVCMYDGKHVDVWADSLLLAIELGRAHFKPPKSKRHMVTAYLAIKDGKEVVHSTAGIG